MESNRTIIISSASVMRIITEAKASFLKKICSLFWNFFFFFFVRVLKALFGKVQKSTRENTICSEVFESTFIFDFARGIIYSLPVSLWVVNLV